MLVDRAASAAPMASRAARDAYRRASGDVIDVDASDEEREVPRRPLDECTVCFEGFRGAAHDFCGACGRNYHEACRDRWFAFKKARCVCGVRGARGGPRPWRPMPRSRAKRAREPAGLPAGRRRRAGTFSSYATNDRGERWADVHCGPRGGCPRRRLRLLRRYDVCLVS